nr:unnamed protein product [Callosobruchus chinensis]
MRQTMANGGRNRILVKDLNSVITCRLCDGYLIDATTLVDCFHVCKYLILGPRIVSIFDESDLSTIICFMLQLVKNFNRVVIFLFLGRKCQKCNKITSAMDTLTFKSLAPPYIGITSIFS